MKHSPTGRTHADKLDWHRIECAPKTAKPSPLLAADYASIEQRLLAQYGMKGVALAAAALRPHLGGIDFGALVPKPPSATALFYKRSALRFERDAVRYAGLSSRWARKKVSMYTAAAADDRRRRKVILAAYLIHRRSRKANKPTTQLQPRTAK